MPGVLGWALGADWVRGVEGGVGGAQPAARGPSALSLSVLLAPVRQPQQFSGLVWAGWGKGRGDSYAGIVCSETFFIPLYILLEVSFQIFLDLLRGLQ